jgi:hypothetical protein
VTDLEAVDHHKGNNYSLAAIQCVIVLEKMMLQQCFETALLSFMLSITNI